MKEKVLATRKKPTNALSSQLPQRFSFLPSEQDAYVEPILGFVEKSFYRFIIKHDQRIPNKTKENFVSRLNPQRKADFSDADLSCLLSFITQNLSLFKLGQQQTLFEGTYKTDPLPLFESFKVEAVNHKKLGIAHIEGRWNDEKLRRLSTLALEIVICLGDSEAFQPLVEIKHKLEAELAERMIMKRRKREGEDYNAKRGHLTNVEYGEFTDFALSLVSKLEKNEEQVKQVIRMAIAKNEALVNIWRSLITQRDEDAKIKKFVNFVNIRFNLVIILK
ncbi:1175_t:CDS:2 [Acaulospora colombiana]|uniref:1175_t:CDS:1 n=1 Tax=Acaulospora colombiana TaxID=27376 RepID=A0ACA9MSJ6_9GLOM|nr:1175_t:CDS:2 [Acaulospora colombiana]